MARKFINFEKCNHCKRCQWREIGTKKKQRKEICTDDSMTPFPDCFEKEDWRDNIFLETPDADEMTLEEKRKQAEIENPHIVSVQKEIKRERATFKRAKDIYYHIMQNGGIHGYTLIR